MTRSSADDFHDTVLAWGTANLRDLPWRQTRDPWAILVSETMLQQTQVDRVIPKYGEFLGHFGNPAACANASLADVLRIWQGLGYPRRARQLHEAASTIANAERFPDTLESLLALPGVGPYTARAVLVFAFETPAAVVDTNIGRVLARFVNRTLRSAEAQACADELALATSDVWLWNQTLMEIGATRCRPRAADCADCPMAARCQWRGVGTDPAVGSAAVSRSQPRFEGSVRQQRGRVLRLIAAGPVTIDELARHLGTDGDQAASIVAGLVRDKLVMRHLDEIGLVGEGSVGLSTSVGHSSIEQRFRDGSRADGCLR